jgi:hypothetical protein
VVWLQGMTQRGVFEEQHVTDYLLRLLLHTTRRHKHMHYIRRPHAQTLSHTLSHTLSLVHTHTHPSYTHTHTHKPKHKLRIHTNTTQYRFFGGGKCHNKTEFTHKLLTEKRWNAILKRFHSKTQRGKKKTLSRCRNPRARRYIRFLETGDVTSPGFSELRFFLSRRRRVCTHTDAAGPINLVMDLRIAHERWLQLGEYL